MSIRGRRRVWVAALAASGIGGVASAQELELDPAAVRAAAAAEGLRPLGDVEIPKVPNRYDFVRNTRASRTALRQLGKAFFWDMQVGSDGQACGTCHFHAGADSRAKNQLSPGLRHTFPALQTRFDPTGSGGTGGPNHELVAADFPFHRLADPEDRRSALEFDTDDVASSQGVFHAAFVAVERRGAELGKPVADPTFRVGRVNVRRVEPRNTPTMINAVFNHSNFWDGRAHNVFNGASVIGPLDAGAVVWFDDDEDGLVARQVAIPNSSLASQAVGPPGSDLEMSFFGRSLRDVGRKLLRTTPLARQLVHPRDGVLGSLSRAWLDLQGNVRGARGLALPYASLIRHAFRSRWWRSELPIDGYTQMESNMGLFFGLAVQAYEATLVSDRTPFDAFMAGDDAALEPEALRGLAIFVNRGRSADPIFAGLGQGNCVSCHGGAEFTDAGFSSLAGDADGLELIEVEQAPVLAAGELGVGEATTFLDNGFSNIGVRPTREDLGRGGVEAGVSLAFARQALAGLDFAPERPSCGGVDEPACPEAGRVAVDGAFKVPGLRNVELTGPYFHNGGQAALQQVIEFYDRQGDFSDENLENLDPNLARIRITEVDEEPLVAFLLSLTDERVRSEKGPFDHPQLFVPNGHAGDEDGVRCVEGLQSCDDRIEIPPIGKRGRSAAGLAPLGSFLGLAPAD